MSDPELKPQGPEPPWFAWVLAAIALGLVVGSVEWLVKMTSRIPSALMLVAGLMLLVVAVRASRKR